MQILDEEAEGWNKLKGARPKDDDACQVLKDQMPESEGYLPHRIVHALAIRPLNGDVMWRRGLRRVHSSLG